MAYLLSAPGTLPSRVMFSSSFAVIVCLLLLSYRRWVVSVAADGPVAVTAITCDGSSYEISSDGVLSITASPAGTDTWYRIADCVHAIANPAATSSSKLRRVMISRRSSPTTGGAATTSQPAAAAAGSVHVTIINSCLEGVTIDGGSAEGFAGAVGEASVVIELINTSAPFSSLSPSWRSVALTVDGAMASCPAVRATIVGGSRFPFGLSSMTNSSVVLRNAVIHSAASTSSSADDGCLHVTSLSLHRSTILVQGASLLGEKLALIVADVNMTHGSRIVVSESRISSRWNLCVGPSFAAVTMSALVIQRVRLLDGSVMLISDCQIAAMGSYAASYGEPSSCVVHGIVIENVTIFTQSHVPTGASVASVAENVDAEEAHLQFGVRRCQISVAGLPQGKTVWTVTVDRMTVMDPPRPNDGHSSTVVWGSSSTPPMVVALESLQLQSHAAAVPVLVIENSILSWFRLRDISFSTTPAGSRGLVLRRNVMQNVALSVDNGGLQSVDISEANVTGAALQFTGSMRLDSVALEACDLDLHDLQDEIRIANCIVVNSVIRVRGAPPFALTAGLQMIDSVLQSSTLALINVTIRVTLTFGAAMPVWAAPPAALVVLRTVLSRGSFISIAGSDIDFTMTVCFHATDSRQSQIIAGAVFSDLALAEASGILICGTAVSARGSPGGEPYYGSNRCTVHGILMRRVDIATGSRCVVAEGSRVAAQGLDATSTSVSAFTVTGVRSLSSTSGPLAVLAFCDVQINQPHAVPGIVVSDSVLSHYLVANVTIGALKSSWISRALDVSNSTLTDASLTSVSVSQSINSACIRCVIGVSLGGGPFSAVASPPALLMFRWSEGTLDGTIVRVEGLHIDVALQAVTMTASTLFVQAGTLDPPRLTRLALRSSSLIVLNGSSIQTTSATAAAPLGFTVSDATIEDASALVVSSSRVETTWRQCMGPSAADPNILRGIHLANVRLSVGSGLYLCDTSVSSIGSFVGDYNGAERCAVSGLSFLDVSVSTGSAFVATGIHVVALGLKNSKSVYLWQGVDSMIMATDNTSSVTLDPAGGVGGPPPTSRPTPATPPGPNDGLRADVTCQPWRPGGDMAVPWTVADPLAMAPRCATRNGVENPTIVPTEAAAATPTPTTRSLTVMGRRVAQLQLWASAFLQRCDMCSMSPAAHGQQPSASASNTASRSEISDSTSSLSISPSATTMRQGGGPFLNATPSASRSIPTTAAKETNHPASVDRTSMAATATAGSGGRSSRSLTAAATTSPSPSSPMVVTAFATVAASTPPQRAVIAAAITAGSATALVGAFLNADPSDGLFLARLASVTGLTRCFWDHNQSLPFGTSMLPMLRLGTVPGSIYRGAVLANFLAVVLASVASVVMGKVVLRRHRAKRIETTANLGADGSSEPTWWCSAGWPGVPIALFCMVLDATVAAAITAAAQSRLSDDGERSLDALLLAAAAIMTCASAVLIAVAHVRTLRSLSIRFNITSSQPTTATHPNTVVTQNTTTVPASTETTGSLLPSHRSDSSTSCSSWAYWLRPTGTWRLFPTTDGHVIARDLRHFQSFGRLFRGVRGEGVMLADDAWRSADDGRTATSTATPMPSSIWKQYLVGPCTMPAMDVVLSSLSAMSTGYARAMGEPAVCEQVGYLTAVLAIVTFLLLLWKSPSRVRGKKVFQLVSAALAAVTAVLIATVLRDVNAFWQQTRVAQPRWGNASTHDGPAGAALSSVAVPRSIVQRADWAGNVAAAASAAGMAAIATSIASRLWVRRFRRFARRRAYVHESSSDHNLHPAVDVAPTDTTSSQPMLLVVSSSSAPPGVSPATDAPLPSSGGYPSGASLLGPVHRGSRLIPAPTVQVRNPLSRGPAGLVTPPSPPHESP